MSRDAQLAAVLEWLWRGAPPREVDRKARLLLLDTLGCVIAASRQPKLRRLAARLAKVEPGKVRVPGFPQRLSVSAAAYLFATSACWDEACEGLARAHGRPGVPVIAACHALAQSLKLSFGATLRAIVAGYEAGGRMGEAVRMSPGMHVDATWPGLGVAVAVVRLSGGTAAQALDAVRIASCQMPHSLYLPVKAGADARNTYLSHAAQLGLLAAHASLAGITAPAGALDEIGAGSFAARGKWLLLEGYLKPYAAVRHVHYGVAAALALRPQLAGRLRAITRIELSTYAEALTYCGNRAPKTPIQAQFSLSFGVAAALATGDLGPSAYGMDDRTIAGLERKVVLSENRVLTKSGRRGATLVVRLGGERLKLSVNRVSGDPAQPMTRAEVLAKFERYSGRPATAAERRLSRP